LFRRRNNGNNWVILAIVVRLGFVKRPVALPVGFAISRGAVLTTGPFDRSTS
jgi:hypothetical protein